MVVVGAGAKEDLVQNGEGEGRAAQIAALAEGIGGRIVMVAAIERATEVEGRGGIDGRNAGIVGMDRAVIQVAAFHRIGAQQGDTGWIELGTAVAGRETTHGSAGSQGTRRRRHQARGKCRWRNWGLGQSLRRQDHHAGRAQERSESKTKSHAPMIGRGRMHGQKLSRRDSSCTDNQHQPRLAKLTKPSLATITWSRTLIPQSSPTWRRRVVNSRSWRDGVGSPEG